MDATGAAYVAGSEQSADFPVTAGAFQTISRHSGQGNAFLTKLTPDGSGLVYSTLLGGSSGDGESANGIALDSAGDAYITGTTNAPDLPTTPDAFQPAFHRQIEGRVFFVGDVFIAKFDPTGSKLIFSSYLGGGGSDTGLGIAVDQIGDAYITGFTTSTGFPVTPFAFQPTINPGGAAGPADAFVAKLALGNRAAISVTGVLPNLGGNAGNVTATVVGSGFQANATMKLVCGGQADIIATNVTVASDGRTITGTFALIGSTTETCDVMVTNADGGSATDARSFTVEKGGSPNLWVDIVGRPNIRGGSTQSYYVVYGNRGSVDAAGVVLIEVQNSVTWNLLNGQIPILEQAQPALLRAFADPLIPPQSSKAVAVTLVAPTAGVDVFVPFRARAWVDPQ